MTARASGPATESATSRLSRLLTMVPWLLNRQGIEIEEAAREFGVSPEQLEADLELLFVCGTPGHLPDDLIEAEWEDGRVYLGNADTIARPLRLGVDEALALIVGLRALAAVPGLRRARRRRPRPRQARGARPATRPPPAPASRSRSRVDAAAESLADARRALAGRRRVHLRYFVPARDEATERDVDPMRVVNVDAHWYLEGWCHVAEDVRLFRLDRIEAIDVLDVDGTPPADARPRDLDSGVFTPVPRPAGRPATGARRGLGRRLLPDRAGGVARGRQLAGLAAHGRHRAGCAGCCGGWGRRPPCSSRPPSRPRCGPVAQRGPGGLRGPPTCPRCRAGRLVHMWWWVLIWAVLVLCATVYLGARLWTLWGQTKELGGELAARPGAAWTRSRASSTSSASGSPRPSSSPSSPPPPWTAGASASSPGAAAAGATRAPPTRARVPGPARRLTSSAHEHSTPQARRAFPPWVSEVCSRRWHIVILVVVVVLRLRLEATARRRTQPRPLDAHLQVRGRRDEERRQAAPAERRRLRHRPRPDGPQPPAAAGTTPPAPEPRRRSATPP